MKKGIASISATVALLSGCAITSGHDTGPNGRPVHWIDGMSASAAYKKASQLCPMGYDILGSPNQVSLLDYVMTIECKARTSQPSSPTTSQVVPASMQYAPISGKGKEQLLEDLSNTPGITYEEYQRRYRLIMAQ